MKLNCNTVVIHPRSPQKEKLKNKRNIVWLDFGLAKSDESEDKVGLLMAGAAPDQENSGIQEIRRSGRDSCQLELEKLPSSGILRMPAYRSLDRCVSLGELCKRWPSYLWTRKLRSGVVEKTLD